MRSLAKGLTVSSIFAVMLAGTARAQEVRSSQGSNVAPIEHTVALPDTPTDGPTLSGAFDISVLNDYITPHGLVATTRGQSVQLQASATLALDNGLSFTGGAWTDINPGFDKIGNTTRTVNETDPFFAVSYAATKKLTLTAKYIPFIGNNLPRTANNLAFVASYADGATGQRFTINPYAVFFWEVSGSSVIGVGKGGHTFDTWLGANPTLKLKGFTITAPTWITLAPKSFFGPIDDGNLGLVTTGLKLIKPLNLGPRAGKWSVYAAAQYYHLANDNLVLVKSAINRGDHKRDNVQFGVGVNVGF